MGFLKAPKPAAPPPAPDPANLEAEAQAEAEAEARKLRKGRVQTVLTSGQGLEGAEQTGLKTVLGG